MWFNCSGSRRICHLSVELTLAINNRRMWGFFVWAVRRKLSFSDSSSPAVLDEQRQKKRITKMKKTILKISSMDWFTDRLNAFRCRMKQCFLSFAKTTGQLVCVCSPWQIDDSSHLRSLWWRNRMHLFGVRLRFDMIKYVKMVRSLTLIRLLFFSLDERWQKILMRERAWTPANMRILSVVSRLRTRLLALWLSSERIEDTTISVERSEAHAR